MKKIKDYIIAVLSGLVVGLLIALKYSKKVVYNITAKNKRKGTQTIKDLTINTENRKLAKKFKLFKRLKNDKNSRTN